MYLFCFVLFSFCFLALRSLGMSMEETLLVMVTRSSGRMKLWSRGKIMVMLSSSVNLDDELKWLPLYPQIGCRNRLVLILRGNKWLLRCKGREENDNTRTTLTLKSLQKMRSAKDEKKHQSERRNRWHPFSRVGNNKNLFRPPGSFVLLFLFCRCRWRRWHVWEELLLLVLLHFKQQHQQLIRHHEIIY